MILPTLKVYMKFPIRMPKVTRTGPRPQGSRLPEDSHTERMSHNNAPRKGPQWNAPKVLQDLGGKPAKPKLGAHLVHQSPSLPGPQEHISLGSQVCAVPSSPQPRLEFRSPPSASWTLSPAILYTKAKKGFPEHKTDQVVPNHP